MSAFRLKLPSLGTVLGFTALVVAVVGTANATPSQTLIRKGDIAPGAVTAGNLAPGAVKTKALAAGAVTSKKLGDGAVNKRVLANAAVIAAKLADNAVTAKAVAPGSVYGGALGEQTIHSTPIKDIDAVAENGTWTASSTEFALCGPGERLLGGGFAFTQPGNKEASFLQALPFISPTGSGLTGRISTNSGGTAEGQIVALCLK